MATPRQTLRDDILRNIDRQILFVHRKEEAFNNLPPEYHNQYSKQRLAALKETAEKLHAARQRLNIIKGSADDTLFNEEITKVKAAISTFEHELSEISPLQSSEYYPEFAETPWRQALLADRMLRKEFSPNMDAEAQAESILKKMELAELADSQEYTELQQALESFRTKNDYYKQVLENSVVAESEQALAAEKARVALYELRAKSHGAFATLVSVSSPDVLKNLDNAIPNGLQMPSGEIAEIRAVLTQHAIAEFMLAEIAASRNGTKDPEYAVYQQALAAAQHDLQELRQEYGVKVDFEKDMFSSAEVFNLAAHPVELRKFIRAQETMLDQFDLIQKIHDQPDFYDIRKKFLKGLETIRALKVKLSGLVTHEEIREQKILLIQALFGFMELSKTVREIIINNSPNVTVLKDPKQAPELKEQARIWVNSKIADDVHNKFFALDPRDRFKVLMVESNPEELESLLTPKMRKGILNEDRSSQLRKVFSEHFSEEEVAGFLAKELESEADRERHQFKTPDDFPTRSPRELIQTGLKALEKAQERKDPKAVEKAMRHLDDATAFYWELLVQHHKNKGDLHVYLAEKSSSITSCQSRPVDSQSSKATPAQPKKKWYTAAWDWVSSWWKRKPAPSANTRQIERGLSTSTHKVHAQEATKHESKQYSVFSHSANFLEKEKRVILDMHDRMHRLMNEDKSIQTNRKPIITHLNRIDALYNGLAAAKNRLAGLSEYSKKNKSAMGETSYETQAKEDYKVLTNLIAQVEKEITALELETSLSRKGSQVELGDEGEGEGIKARKKSH